MAARDETTAVHRLLEGAPTRASNQQRRAANRTRCKKERRRRDRGGMAGAAEAASANGAPAASGQGRGSSAAAAARPQSSQASASLLCPLTRAGNAKAGVRAPAAALRCTRRPAAARRGEPAAGMCCHCARCWPPADWVRWPAARPSGLSRLARRSRFSLAQTTPYFFFLPSASFLLTHPLLLVHLLLYSHPPSTTTTTSPPLRSPFSVLLRLFSPGSHLPSAHCSPEASSPLTSFL